MNKTLTILRGAPGAGKSTFAKLLAKSNDAIILSADTLMVDENGNYKFDASKLQENHESCFNVAKLLIHNGENIILDNTNTKEEHFDNYIDYAISHGYVVFSIVVENRHGNVSIHNVPQETVVRHSENIKGSLKLY